MSEIATDLSPSKLVEYVENNMLDFWTYLGHSSRVELYDGPDMIRMCCEVPSPLCNNVFRAKFRSDETDHAVSVTLDYFRSRHLPLRWWTSPSMRPADLGTYLEAHGLVRIGDVPGMAVDMLELNEDIEIASDLVIEHVGNVNALQQMIIAFTLGYEIPGSVGELVFDMLSDLGFEMPLRHYVGYLRGKPVACSSLFFSAGVAGIYLVATVPEERGKGIGSALTLIPLLEARDMGYRIGILGSSEMGLGVYQRLGFQEYFKFGHYIYGG